MFSTFSTLPLYVLPSSHTAAIAIPGPGPIAPGALAGAITPAVIIFILVVVTVMVVLVLRSSRSGKQDPSSPSVESSEDNCLGTVGSCCFRRTLT